ncbi:hypothetical protein [Pseudomonas taetrolens]|uniref:hypothetical protein n=1 Tax=Pseudomonas taetrolens TaxID=47884 RepID=UPI0030D71A24
MTKAFRNPMFLVGFPLVICGSVFGLVGLLSNLTFAYMAPGMLVPGIALMLSGWRQRNA